VLSGGRAGESIYDSDQNIGSSSVDVPAGQTITWDIAYSVADPTNLLMTVSAGLFADEIVFTT
ncbi:MAG: hypothetical protein LBI33_10185, partial [Propionibacteriaceae bacterium]|jgi:hypothetical protein|nr:hypothetical protein [Propionibacteriaceae bacterium]